MKKALARVFKDQRVRFLAIGGVNTVIGFGLFSVLTVWVFDEVPFGYLLSLVGSYAIAIVVAFFLYRRFVFVVTGNVLIDFLRFVTVYLGSIAINAIALPLLVELLSLHPVLAQALVLVVTTLVSFFGHRSFSFRRAGDPAPDE